MVSAEPARNRAAGRNPLVPSELLAHVSLRKLALVDELIGVDLVVNILASGLQAPWCRCDCESQLKMEIPAQTNIPLRHALVVVTGASTGIGAATARELAKRGFHVLAGQTLPAQIATAPVKVSSK